LTFVREGIYNLSQVFSQTLHYEELQAWGFHLIEWMDE